MAKDRKFDWFPLHSRDYLSKTKHLTTQQHGAYLLLLMDYFEQERGLNLAHMPGIAKVSRDEWDSDVWPALAEFFSLGEDGYYHNKKADELLAERLEISAKRSAAGQASAASRAWARMDSARLHAATEQTATSVQHLLTQVQVQEEERSPPSEGGEPPPKMVQASLLEIADEPPTTEKMLWSEGLAIFARLGKKPPASCRGQLGDLAKIAGPEVLLDVLRNHRDKPGKDSAYAWVKQCCEVRKNQTPRLVVDNDPNDAWGIDAWCRSLPGVVSTSSDTERAIGKWVIHGRVIDAFAKSIAQAAMLPRSWRGDWSALEGWARDKIKTNDAIAAVKSRAEWGEYDAGRVSSIKLFDTSVRGGRKAA